MYGHHNLKEQLKPNIIYNMNFFVTLKGEEVRNNLTRDKAVMHAKSLLENSELGMLEVGIGVVKNKNGKLVYNLMPSSFYLDNYLNPIQKPNNKI